MSAAASGSRPSLLGAEVRRIEDDRLLTGRGAYVADIRLPRMLEAAFVRSHHAHAVIARVDGGRAVEAEGVRGFFAADDLHGVNPVPDLFQISRPVAEFPLRRGRARYVGAPLAVVVAEDRYLAEDAAELVELELEPLPAVVDREAAAAPGAPRLFEEWPDNVLMQIPKVETPEIERAFRELRTVGSSYQVQRQGCVPMETRGVVAEYRDERLTVWTSTQFPFITRGMLSAVLGLPERQIRVVAPDVGGSFGGKAQVYPEEYVVPWLAIKLRRPVRWIEDRYEHMVSACQARDVQIDVEAAVHPDGRIEAVRGNIYQDAGSGEIYPNGYAPAIVSSAGMLGPYRIRHQAVGVTSYVTNKAPSGAYRGFGLPEGVFAMERLIDRVANELGIDRLEIRRRNLLDDSDLPYETASGARYDSGSFRRSFERAVELGEEMLADERRRHAGDPALRIAAGYSTYVEGTAPTYFTVSGQWTAQETVDVRFDPDGGVTVAVGISAYGQGVGTMVATVVADQLAVPLESVRVLMGDTDTAAYGLGSFGSRSTVVTCGAVEIAAAELREKGGRIAAHMLEVAAEDLVLEDGAFGVPGTEARIGWKDIAGAALMRTVALPPEVRPGLEARATYEADGIEHFPRPDGRINVAATYANSTHAAVVAVDPATGVTRVLRYAVVHDCGRVINPLIVMGQVHGGVAQGIGGALYEEFTYGDGGQPTATTFMDYVVPSATEIPPIEVEEIESPSPNTTYGVKGVGEAGIIGPPAAIAQAVESALEDLGVAEVAFTPLGPAAVRRLLAEARP